jgi:hypothetical protein
MATLVFIDGRREQVSYNQAAGIKLVKEGAIHISGKPVTDRQKAFAASVEEIIFEPIRVARKEGCIKNDPKIREIINDPKLKGKKKFDAIRSHITGK